LRIARVCMGADFGVRGARELERVCPYLVHVCACVLVAVGIILIGYTVRTRVVW
jgi:hypothetical protein